MVDQSSITGEFKPVEKIVGSRVFAGTTNHAGMLEVRTEKLGRDTVFGRIIEAVEKAEQSRAPIQKVADRLSAWLVYFALAFAFATLVITHNLRSTIAVVIVAGACGIAAGTSLAVLGAIGRSAQGGAIVKGGRYMEALGTIDTVILNKTGTLTFGEPYVVAVTPCSWADSAQVLRLAAVAERPSEHSLAKAILREASRLKVALSEPDTFEYLPGKGIRALWNGGEILVGNTALLSAIRNLDSQLRTLPEDAGDILVAYRGRLVGAMHTNDVLRPEAKESVARIRGMRIETILLTGERRQIAEEVARQLGGRGVRRGAFAGRKAGSCTKADSFWKTRRDDRGWDQRRPRAHRGDSRNRDGFGNGFGAARCWRAAFGKQPDRLRRTLEHCTALPANHLL
jgi:P-type E1-E2 ATPase